MQADGSSSSVERNGANAPPLANGSDLDLSAGMLSPSQAKAVGLGLEEQVHRISLQKTAFNGAMSFAAVMLMVAIGLAMCAFGLYAGNEKFDWHMTLLVGAFLVPSTVVTVALLRAAFPKSSAKDDSDFPSAEAIKNLKDLVDVVRPGDGPR